MEYSFEDLERARDEIILQGLRNEEVDLTTLRNICKERDPEGEVFKIDGSDNELWKSVNAYFRAMLPF